MKLDLWTLQTDAFVEHLFDKGISWDVHPPEDVMFKHAYDWLIDQMCFKQSRHEKKYPLWAWRQYDYLQCRPDMRLQCVQAHLKQAPNLLHIRLDPSRVTLTDYTHWHACLNNTLCLTPEQELLDDLPDTFPLTVGSLNVEPDIQHLLYASWNRIFDIPENVQKDDFSPIQATFFELYPKDIVRIQRWKKA